jgi:translocator protein
VIDVRALVLSLAAVLATLLLTALLSPPVPGDWYEALARPTMVIPPLVVLLLSVGFYPAFTVALYRSLTTLAPQARQLSLGLLLAVLVGQVIWNPLLLRPEGLGWAVAASGILAGAMVALEALLLPRDRVAGLVLLPYTLFALHEFWWTRELLRLNPELG